MKAFILCCLAVLILPASGFSEPLIYSFEGEISSFSYDGAGIIANGGYKIGDRVYAKFYVHFDKDGYSLLNNGRKEIAESPPMTNAPYWCFYDSLISGTLLPEVNGGLNNRLDDVKEYHFGCYMTYPVSSNCSPLDYCDPPVSSIGDLVGGTGDSNITISRINSRVQDWVVGEEVTGFMYGYSDKDVSVIDVDMKLIGIESTLPDLRGQWSSLTQHCRSASRRGSRCSIHGTLNIQNLGYQDALPSFVNFYLSDDDAYDEGVDIFLERVGIGRVKAGGSRTVSLNVDRLKEIVSGKYVIAVIDAGHAVAEASERNNAVVFGPVP